MNVSDSLLEEWQLNWRLYHREVGTLERPLELEFNGLSNLENEITRLVWGMNSLYFLVNVGGLKLIRCAPERGLKITASEAEWIGGISNPPRRLRMVYPGGFDDGRGWPTIQEALLPQNLRQLPNLGLV
ncbi:MAG TPA: hypothetical protein VNG90_02410 [Candidatus Acidoferrum sp.]|nr:hypothetical protein [Candidatus Acidoferrum sp.]